MLKLVFFSGVDGSGKSTHAKLLLLYLKRRGIRAKLLWMRWFALSSYPLLLLCRWLGLTKWPQRGAIPVREYWRYRPIAILWLYLHLFEYLLYVVFKLFFSKNVIIADRFMLDVFVDVLYDTRINAVRTLVGKFFLLYFYKLLMKDVIRGIVMYVDAITAFRRRSDVPCKSYIVFRVPVYLALARFFNLPIIDGRNEFAENFKYILKYLGLEYG